MRPSLRRTVLASVVAAVAATAVVPSYAHPGHGNGKDHGKRVGQQKPAGD